MKLLHRISRLFSSTAYENANPSRRRATVPGAAPTDTNKELTSHTRRELVRRSRYLNRNSGFAREIVADMATYTTGDGIQPQALTGDPEWSKAAEDYFARWAARAGDGIQPQALTGDPEWSKAAEDYFARWAAWAGDGIQPQALTDDLEWNKAAEDYFSRWAAAVSPRSRMTREKVSSRRMVSAV